MKICIIGTGMVGSQLASWFKDSLTYDTQKQSNSWEECSQADCFFVCVPSNYKENEEYDLSHLEEAIVKIPDGKLVVIKSTVNPGTTDYFQEKYPDKMFMFNPEFLSEDSAKKDFFEPDMQILGIGVESEKYASEIMMILPSAPITMVVSRIDAEWIKKIRNSYYAMKVIYFNQMYDIIQKSGASYETIRGIVTKNKWIGDSHSFINHKDYRGYGGACLPKDTDSLIDYAKRVGAPSELLETIKQLNELYRETGGNSKE